MAPTPDDLAQLILGTIQQALAPLRAQLTRLDDQLTAAAGRLELYDQLVPALRERLAVVESRPPLPGPPGADGQPGQDGVGFDDLAASFDGDRTLTLAFTRGAVVKTFPVVLPIPRYCGVFSAAQTYRVGDLVTWAGSMWTCTTSTSSKPDEHAGAWRLVVKRGRDGRDGKA